MAIYILIICTWKEIRKLHWHIFISFFVIYETVILFDPGDVKMSHVDLFVCL